MTTALLSPPQMVQLNGKPTPVIWTPQRGSQTLFLQCPLPEALYEGTRGPGKTDALLMDFAQHVGKGYGAEWKGVIFRKTYPELQDVIEKSRKWFKQSWLQAEYNESKSFWEWPTGELLYFRQFAKPADYWKYHGHAFPFIGWEELTTWVDDQCFRSMFSCSRSTVPGIPRRIRATTNPYGCVPYGEVLTATRGWISIGDVRVGEAVVSVNADGQLIESSVSAVICQDYDGIMVRRDGAGIAMEFTADHRLPHYSTDRSRFTIKPFDQLPGQAYIKRTGSGWNGLPMQEFSPPRIASQKRKSRISQPLSVRGEDFAELLGWFVSEGSLIPQQEAFCIAQCKANTRRQIHALLTRMGFTYSYSKNTFYVYDRHWTAFFLSLGRYCHEKSLPRWFLRCEAVLLRKCFDAAMAGDGSRGIYYTYSRLLADQIQEIAVKLGYSVMLSSRQRKTRTRICYQVQCSSRTVTELNTGNHLYKVRSMNRSINVTKEHFVGQVHCLTVPETETFFLRQHGCVWLSGNSGHNWVKKRYRLPVKPGQIVGEIIRDARDESGLIEPVRVAIHGYLDENQILMRADPDYKQRISAAARNESERKAWLHGSWDIVAGGMVDDVWDRTKHCIEPFKIPAGWIIDRAFDWGSSKPFALQWWAESDGSAAPTGKAYPKGSLFLIAQWYGCTKKDNEGLRMLAVDIAREGLKREAELKRMYGIQVQAGPADPSIFSKENGNCIADDMALVGMRFEPADASKGSRKNGAERVRKYLEAAKKWPMEAPGLFVFHTNAHWLRTVPVVPRDLKDPDDVDTESEDHDWDATRYRAMFKRATVSSQKLVGT